MDFLKNIKKFIDWELNIKRCGCGSTHFIRICRKCGDETEL